MYRALLFAVLLLPSSLASAVERVQYFVTPMQPGTRVVISNPKVGQEFDLGVFVKDLRPAGTWVNDQGFTKPLIRGVFAAYCDIHFDTSLCSEYGIVFNDDYPNGKEYHSTSGLGIDETGAFSNSMNGLGTAPKELFRIRVKCKEAGVVVFRPTFNFPPKPDGFPDPKYDTLIYGNIAANPPEQSHVDQAEMRINPVTVTIVP